MEETISHIEFSSTPNSEDTYPLIKLQISNQEYIIYLIQIRCDVTLPEPYEVTVIRSDPSGGEKLDDRYKHQTEFRFSDVDATSVFIQLFMIKPDYKYQFQLLSPRSDEGKRIVIRSIDIEEDRLKYVYKGASEVIRLLESMKVLSYTKSACSGFLNRID